MYVKGHTFKVGETRMHYRQHKVLTQGQGGRTLEPCLYGSRIQEMGDAHNCT